MHHNACGVLGGTIANALTQIILSRVAFVVLVGCVGWLIYTHSLFGTGPITIAVQVAAALLMLWARVIFGMRSFHASANPTEGGLVTSGPYRWLRHPIYAAIFWFVWAGVAAHPSIDAAGTAALATVMLAVRVASEEKLLTQRYPEYADYAQHTSRLLPFLF
ncbi:MAG TPA: isoprenylcysteine carboxylmethyltransferase family protein [Bryobacteraceae bacterium]|nr:isoprenylcysteine carboxylmethyltransferase family protein [Bryobacteraceae bacterium]